MICLGIDCGTQSLKVIAWEPDSGSLTAVSASYGLIEGLPPGHKEQHPATWIEALESCILRLKEHGLRAEGVAAIGVSGQQHGLVVLDERDQVIRPAKLWNDTSTAPQCARILEAAGGRDSYQREIGNWLPPGFTASKILWLKEHEPDAYTQIHRLLLPHDFLNLYLTGEHVTEAGDASGTGYFQVAARAWSARALSWIDPERDLSAALPKLIASGDAAGTLRPELTRKWGFPGAVTVSSGGGDNMMGAIGSGNILRGVVTVSLGTSGTLYGYSPEPVIDPRGDVAAFCDSTGGWLPLGCTMNVTVATEMIRTRFLAAGHDLFEEEIGRVPPGSEGLVLLPYLEGERMPDVPLGTGVLLGLRPATASRGHLARAAMEGVTMGLRYGLDRLCELGISATEIRLIGGGSHSAVWRQIAADLFGVPVVCPKTQEGPAFGAALQALWCHTGGDIRTLAEEFIQLDDTTRCTSDPRRRSLYDELYALYSELAGRMTASPVFQLHRRFIERKDAES